MRFRRRWVPFCIAIVSTLCLAATLWFWIESYLYPARFTITFGPDDEWGCLLAGGVVNIDLRYEFYFWQVPFWRPFLLFAAIVLQCFLARSRPLGLPVRPGQVVKSHIIASYLFMSCVAIFAFRSGVGVGIDYLLLAAYLALAPAVLPLAMIGLCIGGVFPEQRWPMAYACCGFVLVFYGCCSLFAWKDQMRRRRQQRGICANCGYDLRATPDRCPECGLRVTNA